MKAYREISFPKTRIATLNVLEIGRREHHIKELLELVAGKPQKVVAY